MNLNLNQYLNDNGVEKWNKLIGQASKIVVLGHSGPDGDAIGAILAMTHYLQKLGKTATPVTPNSCPDFLRWMPGIERVLTLNTPNGKTQNVLLNADLVMCLDFGSYGRLEDLGTMVRGLQVPVVVIDHHPDMQISADLAVVDTGACATCEILFSVLSQIDPENLRDRVIATCIYCGMMTDTGAFAYNSNRPEIFLATAMLMSAGIDKDKIYRSVYYNYSEQRLRLMGYILNRKMQYFPELHTAIFTLDVNEMKEYNFVRGDAEGIVNLPLQIKGARLSISMREDSEKPIVRISLRSVGDFPCNRMAEDFFNGGGHYNAAGGSLPKPIEKAYETALKAIEAYRSQLV